MRTRLERIPLDLRVTIVLALATLILTLTPLNYLLLGIPRGLVIVLLFVPGYTLASALFPKIGDLGRVARIALSFGLGIAVVPLISLALNYTPWGIRLISVADSLAVFTVFTALAAYWRSMGVPVEERHSTQITEKIISLKTAILNDEKKRLDKALTIILILVIIISISALVYIIVIPKQGEKFTEFYILGPGGKAYDYPTSVPMGDRSTVIVGVVNHEYIPVNYTMHILLNSTSIDDTLMNNTSINSTSIDSTSINNTLLNSTLLANVSMQDTALNHSLMENTSPEENSRLIYSILSTNMTLAYNETWVRPVTYVLNNTGDRQKLEILLYKERNFTEPYRELRLWVNVTKSVSYPPGNATNLTAVQSSGRIIA